MPHSHTDSHSVTHTHTLSREFPSTLCRHWRAIKGQPNTETAPSALCTTLSTVHTLYIPLILDRPDRLNVARIATSPDLLLLPSMLLHAVRIVRIPFLHFFLFYPRAAEVNDTSHTPVQALIRSSDPAQHQRLESEAAGAEGAAAQGEDGGLHMRALPLQHCVERTATGLLPYLSPCPHHCRSTSPPSCSSRLLCGGWLHLLAFFLCISASQSMYVCSPPMS